MELTVPLLNQTLKVKGQSNSVYRVSMLFHPSLNSEDINLRRANQRLMDRVRKMANPIGRQWNHAELAELAFNPHIESKSLKLTLDLKSRRAKARLFFVHFELLDRHVAFAPLLPELWFDLDDPSQLESRAHEVFEHHFRKITNDPHDDRKPEDYASTGETWIAWADVNIRTDPLTAEEQERNFLSLFGSGPMDGASELLSVGRCLDQRFPDGLVRAVNRQDEVGQLDKLLQHPSKRPVLLVGPRQVGKSAVVNEVVYQRVNRRAKKNSNKANLWYLSPQRLISGMSFVGQWEDRLLAIIGEAQKRDHVLYFDDILGMFRAGQSRDSNLCVADLIKNAIEEKQVRILGEMTTDAFHTLESRDRGFADLFQVIRVQPTDTKQTREIAIRVIQELEKKHRCCFQWDVISESTKIQERYGSDAAMPGKLITFLEMLAIKQGNRIVPSHAWRQFRQQTGLFKNQYGDVTGTIRMRLKRQVIGQPTAIQACSNVINVMRAGLNEPERPIASMLFLGPTGVGKTECAKAMAKVIYSSEEQLIRFDLNQFKTGWSATTLVGTPDRPEGLLTSAVRQNPFSIVLFDEIEKAHPTVFDILLQVLGEGRLTDALGRTTDFSNCIIIMTSNLGVRKNQGSLGFAEQSDQDHYRKAAQKFFRPEFYNRIDEIVPFGTLDRISLRKIAQRLLGSVLDREGLMRRHCILKIENAAIDHVVQIGYHPELGARAMKRALEDQFSKPVARKLAATLATKPTVIRVTRGAEALKLDTQEIGEMDLVRTQSALETPQAATEQAQKFLERIAQEHLSERPTGEISSAGISPELLRYFTLDEQRNRVKAAIETLERMQQNNERPQPAIGTQARTRANIFRRDVTNLHSRIMKEMLSVRDIGVWLDELKPAQAVKPISLALQDLLNQAALLEHLCVETGHDSCLMFFRNMQPEQNLLPGAHAYFESIFDNVIALLKNKLGFKVKSSNDDPDECELNWLLVEGPGAESICRLLLGSYMIVSLDGRFALYQMGATPPALVEREDCENTVRKLFEDHDPGPDERAALSIQSIRRLFFQSGDLIDFPSGISCQNDRHAIDTLLDMTLKGIPLPTEFLAAENGEPTHG